MQHSPHTKKLVRIPTNSSASNQELIEEVIQPKSPSLALLSQRWQKIRLLILQELADQSTRG